MTSRYVVMGVSGCGKSHIGADFAAKIGAIFVDGDDLHPEENIAKMSRGEPLNDDDRAPWLDLVGHALNDDTVVACSALKRSYRDRIRMYAGGPVVFVFLEGSREVLLDRVNNRPGHFMPPSLLDSQLATLEPPQEDELFITADIAQTPAEIVQSIVAATQEFTL